MRIKVKTFVFKHGLLALWGGVSMTILSLLTDGRLIIPALVFYIASIISK